MSVADAAAPCVSLFNEVRFGTDAAGRWAASDSSTAGEAWDRYTAHGRLRLVARASRERGSAVVALAPDVEVVALPYYQGVSGLVRQAVPLALAVRRAVTSADIVVLRVPGAVSGLAGLVCRLTRRPYAVEVVGDPVDVLASGALGAAGRLLAAPAGSLMRWVVSGATSSRYVSQSTLQRRYPPRAGTPTAAISNVRLGPGALVTAPRRRRSASAHLVAVGSQETTYKGHDVLLRAVRLLADRGHDVTATIVGGGRLHEQYVARARSLGVAERVSFTGQVRSRPRLLELLDEADVFVMPSRTEGVPRALIEAMARALPAVGTRVGGIPELLDPSCLVPVDDAEALARAAEALLCDAAAWERQSARNLEGARAYDGPILDRRFADWLAALPATAGVSTTSRIATGAAHARAARP